MNNSEMLDLKFHSSDLNREITIRDFLKELLITLFLEKEAFSGKRPFGNGGWHYDMVICLCKNECIKSASCLIDPEYPEDEDWDWDWSEADDLCLELIRKLN